MNLVSELDVVMVESGGDISRPVLVPNVDLCIYVMMAAGDKKRADLASRWTLVIKVFGVWVDLQMEQMQRMREKKHMPTPSNGSRHGPC